MDKGAMPKLKNSTFQWIIVVTYIFALYKLELITNKFNDLFQTLTPFIIGFVIAYLVNIIVVKIENIIELKSRNKNKLTEKGYKVIVILIYFLTVGIIVGSSLVVVPSVVTSIENIVVKLSNIDVANVSNDISKLIHRFTGRTYVIDDLIAYATKNMMSWLNNFKDLLPYIAGATSQVFKMLTIVFFGSIISIYMLLNKKKYLVGIKSVSKAYIGNEKTLKLGAILNKTNTVFADFISTVLFGAVLVSTITFVGASLMGISNALLIAIVIAIGNLIPFFGPILGLLTAIILVIISSPDRVIFYAIFAIALQQFDANVINPKIVGDKLGLDALLVIFAVIIMSGLFGILGTFIGVPVFAVVYFLFKESVDKKLNIKQ